MFKFIVTLILGGKQETFEYKNAVHAIDKTSILNQLNPGSASWERVGE